MTAYFLGGLASSASCYLVSYVIYNSTIFTVLEIDNDRRVRYFYHLVDI